MAEMMTPQGLVVGLILNDHPEKGEHETPALVEKAKVDKPTRGRKPKE